MKSYIIVILISALLLSTLFFALPKTENLVPFDEKRFDLNKKEDKYWKEEFILGVEDGGINKQNIEKTKDVLYQRLRKIRVEEIQITSKGNEIKVLVQTTKDPDFVRRLLSSTGKVQLMIPKSELEEIAQEDQIQLYMQENYEKTEWDNTKFRNILIKDLRTDMNEKTYFGIFKPKFGERNNFKNFLREYEGKELGILVDGFVRPIRIEPHLIELFAIALAQDDSEAFTQDLLLNTGTIPTNFSLVESSPIETSIYEINHVQVALALIAGLFSLLFFLYRRETEEKEKVLQLAFSSLLLFSISLTILKVWQIPVDLFLLIPTGILLITFMKTMYTCPSENRSILLLATAISAFMVIFGTGYILILGRFILFGILLSFITEILTKIYFKHIKILNT